MKIRHSKTWQAELGRRGRCKIQATFLVIMVLMILLLLARLRIPPPDDDTEYEVTLELDQRILTEQHLLELEKLIVSEKNSSGVSALKVGRDLIIQLIEDEGPDIKQDDPRLVSYVRKYMLLPPSRLPYNLNPKNLYNNPSEHGSNLIALAQLLQRKNGFFVECGAHDGEYFSNSLLLERDYKWSGLLIEADPSTAELLISKNRKAFVSPGCISPVTTPKMLDFYFEPPASSRIYNAVYRSEVLDRFHGHELKKKNIIPVLCIPLYTYFLALGVSTVDYLSLDVEGADLYVLRTIPFDKVTILVIEVEVQWVPEGGAAVRKFLESKGYVFLKEIGHDFMFVHSSISNSSRTSTNRVVPVPSTG